MSLPPRRAVDTAYSGQAIAESSFTVVNMLANRQSKLVTKPDKIGTIPPNLSNVALAANSLGLAFKQSMSGFPNSAPPVFDSLTGIGYDSRKDTKYDIESSMKFVGRIQQTKRLDGAGGHETTVSVQIGGLGSVRMFLSDPEQTISYGDRLAWTVPDVGNPQKLARQYTHLNSKARAEFPPGKIPVLLKKVDEQVYMEFPVAAFEKFISEMKEHGTYEKFIASPFSADPRGRYVVRTLAIIMKNDDRESFLEAVRTFAGLHSNPQTVYDVAALWDNAPTRLTPMQVKTLKNNATAMMSAQYDAFSYLQDRIVGKSVSVGSSGDMMQILFSP